MSEAPMNEAQALPTIGTKNHQDRPAKRNDRYHAIAGTPHLV
jgi:hypothetical protein